MNVSHRAVQYGVAVALGTALCLATGSAAHSDDASTGNSGPVTVGVVVVGAINLAMAEAVTLGDELAAALKDKLLVTVVTSSEASKLLAPAVSEECVVMLRCVRNLGARLEVQQVLFLTIVRIGNQTQVNVTWADSRSGGTEPRDAIVIDQGATPGSAFRDAAGKLLPGVSARPRLDPTNGKDPGPGNGSAGKNDANRTGNGTGLPTTGPEDRPGRGRHMTAGSWIASGVAVVAVAGAIGFGSAARNLDSELADACPGMVCGPELADKVDRRDLYINLTDASLVVAAASGVTALVLYLLSADSGTSPSVSVSATPTSVGMHVGTRF